MNLAPYIDHTNLKPEATAEDIKKLCAEARCFGFASVCVNSSRVPLAAELLKGTSVSVCTVVGFPLGAASSASKAFEAKKAAEDGASEIDMVINIGLIKDGADEDVIKDIKAVVEAVPLCVVKVIIETCLLTEEEKIRACRAAMTAGAHFVKTSTGFSKGGATREDVKLMRENCPASVKVKAAGGIADLNDAKDFIALGADRLGTSRIVKAVKAMEQ